MREGGRTGAWEGKGEPALWARRGRRATSVLSASSASLENFPGEPVFATFPAAPAHTTPALIAAVSQVMQRLLCTSHVFVSIDRQRPRKR